MTFDNVMHPNGTLYVVTGADKALKWAHCVTNTDKAPLHRLWKSSEITYRGEGEDSPHSWKTNREGRERFNHSRSREIAHLGKCALFIRGMRFALNIRDWTEHLLHYNPPKVIPFNLIRTVPNTGLRAKIQTLKECRSGYTQMIPEAGSLAIQVIFHPLDIILKLLLEEFPSSSVAYIEDRIWFGIAEKCDGDLASILRSLVNILETHETFAEDGRVTLVPRKMETQTQTLSKSMARFTTRLIMQKYRSWYQRRRNLNRLAKVFPGPNVPSHILIPIP